MTPLRYSEPFASDYEVRRTFHGDEAKAVPLQLERPELIESAVDTSERSKIFHDLAEYLPGSDFRGKYALHVFEHERRWMVPRLWVRYKRLAFTSVFGDDARLTVDRFVEVQEPFEESYTIRNDFWRPIPMSPECVLELKYNAAYPHWMQFLVRAVNIQAQSVSKYGRGASVFLEDGMRVSAAWSHGWTGI